MGLFGKSFEEKVALALEHVRGKLSVKDLAAQTDGELVTLTGEVASMEEKTRVMELFNAQVETQNTFNRIRIAHEAASLAKTPALGAPLAAELPETDTGDSPGTETTWHEVISGDTLGGIAQKHYGKASLYTKIFEANRDQLDDPDKIQVGQKLRIP